MQDAAAEMGTKEGFHGYGPEQGYPFLKQAIQGYYAGRGTQLAEDEIFISDGAKSDLANVLGLFDVDNTVLVPDPVYPTYVDDNVTDGRKIIYGRTSQENGFLGMPDDSVKADIIYICSPNNPTGAAYTREQLKAWVDYAKKNNAIILYDAAYECFISDRALWPAASSRSRVPASAPLRSAPSPRSQASPAPAAATPSCPTSWSARA